MVQRRKRRQEKYRKRNMVCEFGAESRGLVFESCSFSLLFVLSSCKQALGEGERS